VAACVSDCGVCTEWRVACESHGAQHSVHTFYCIVSSFRWFWYWHASWWPEKGMKHASYMSGTIKTNLHCVWWNKVFYHYPARKRVHLHITFACSWCLCVCLWMRVILFSALRKSNTKTIYTVKPLLICWWPYSWIWRLIFKSSGMLYGVCE
jgi:hypothetical protein